MTTFDQVVGIWLSPSTDGPYKIWSENVRSVGDWLKTGTQFFEAGDSTTPSGLAMAFQTLTQSNAPLMVRPTPREMKSRIWPEIWEFICHRGSYPTAFLSAASCIGAPPFSNILVPVSGESRESKALELSVSLSEETHLPVDLLHIGGEAQVHPHDSSFSLESISDQPHHEYAERMNDTLARVAPYLSPEQHKRFRSFAHVNGDVSEEIAKAIGRDAHPLLILDWSGTLEHGRALNLKRILRFVECPVILVKTREQDEQMKCQLNVGPRFWETEGNCDL